MSVSIVIEAACLVSATELRTIRWGDANSNLSSVPHSRICDIGGWQNGAFAQVGSVFESLCTSAILLGNVQLPTLVDPCSKAEGTLARAATEGARVHGSQADQED